jgi:hypothetical protein
MTRDKIILWVIVVAITLFIMVFHPVIFAYILMISAFYAILIKPTRDRRKKK